MRGPLGAHSTLNLTGKSTAAGRASPLYHERPEEFVICLGCVRRAHSRMAERMRALVRTPSASHPYMPDSRSGESWLTQEGRLRLTSGGLRLEPRRGNGRCNCTGPFVWGSAYPAPLSSRPTLQQARMSIW